MENIDKNKSMTFEEALNDSSLAHVHEAIRFLEKTPNKDVFPKKYELSMIDLAIENAIELLMKKPDMPLKTLISTIISSFDDDLSADLILKMTKNIIKEWQKLSPSFLQEKPNAIAA
jgi:hypothetical protein